MADTDETLADRVDELESAIEDLRGELSEPPSGPLGIPRPPSPGEVLRFADEYAIPTAIAVLEANLRALRLLQRVLRATRGVEESPTRDRAVDLGRESLARLDDALSDLSAAMEDADLPQDPEARRLLEDVRDLNEDVRDRLAPADGDDPGNGERQRGEATDIDVEAELESIKEEVEDKEEDPGDDQDGDENESEK